MSEEDSHLEYMLVHMSEGGRSEHEGKEEPKGDEFVMVNTVRENYEGCTKHDLEKAKEARRLQGMIGNPTEREFIGMVREKLIANCPITVRDVDNANRIFGPDLANLRGKTTRTKPDRVRVNTSKSPGISSNCTST